MGHIVVIAFCVAGALLGLSCGLLLCGLVFEKIAAYRDSRRYPSPGTMIDVGGHRLSLQCAGQGGPTIVIATGGGSLSLTWAPIQLELAKFSTVCCYDRAGLGWSDSAPTPRTLTQHAAELHTLLVNAGIRGPYLLVGHSYGGLLVRIFAIG
jgi:pimeloyl-ACP methyl ester carboxylesterase